MGGEGDDLPGVAMTRKRGYALDEETVERIVALGPQHYPEEIAKLCNVSVVTVCRVLHRAGVPSKRKETWRTRETGVTKPPTMKEPPAPTMPTSPMEAAKEAFITAPAMEGKSPRLVVTAQRMTLDGWEIGINELMRKTNTIRLGWGLEQIVNCPAWKISVARGEES